MLFGTVLSENAEIANYKCAEAELRLGTLGPVSTRKKTVPVLVFT